MNATPRTGETREEWIAARIAHMLACEDTRAEIIDELSETSAPRHIQYLAAMRCAANAVTPQHQDEARELLEAVLRLAAADLAAGEWTRLPDHAMEAAPC